MRYAIIVSPEAVRDIRRLAARDRAEVSDALELHLRHDPTRVSRSRIKRLRGLAQPQYRLRIGEFRAFYDVVGDEVQVLAVVAKADAESWLREAGRPEEEEDADEDRGALGREG